MINSPLPRVSLRRPALAFAVKPVGRWESFTPKPSHEERSWTVVCFQYTGWAKNWREHCGGAGLSEGFDSPKLSSKISINTFGLELKCRSSEYCTQTALCAWYCRSSRLTWCYRTFLLRAGTGRKVGPRSRQGSLLRVLILVVSASQNGAIF